MDRRALLSLAAPALVLAASAAPAKASSEDGGGGSQDTYVRLPMVTASVLRPDGRRGVLSVETGVDVPDATLRTRAQQSLPRLRAAYNAVAQRTANTLRAGAAPDVAMLSRELQTATNSVLGRPGATVLLGTVMAV